MCRRLEYHQITWKDYSLNKYLTWLHKQMRRLTELYGDFDFEPTFVREIHETAGNIAEQAGERAMKLGLADLHAKSLPLIGFADPLEVKTYLAECVQTCQTPKAVSGQLSVAEAADRLGVSPRTLYRLCAEGRLPHQHLGTGRGTIRIRPEDLAAFALKSGEHAKPRPRITLEQLKAV
jgi:excisionase family DNA binding protein